MTTHRGPFQPRPFCDSVLQEQDRKIVSLVAPLFAFNALKTQLLCERKAAWSAEPGVALLGACKARLCPRQVLSGADTCAPAALALGTLGANRSLQMFVLW